MRGLRRKARFARFLAYPSAFCHRVLDKSFPLEKHEVHNKAILVMGVAKSRLTLQLIQVTNTICPSQPQITCITWRMHAEYTLNTNIDSYYQ